MRGLDFDMFTEKTLNNIIEIDKIVSEYNMKLSKYKSNLYFAWTFPTNHIHDFSIENSYFVIWVGETGKDLMKSIGMSSISCISKLFKQFNTIIDLEEYYNN